MQASAVWSDQLNQRTGRNGAQDMYGDGRHVSIDVVASAFEGKNSVARQRLVYKVGRGLHLMHGT